jgi:hypothetical protein
MEVKINLEKELMSTPVDFVTEARKTFFSFFLSNLKKEVPTMKMKSFRVEGNYLFLDYDDAIKTDQYEKEIENIFTSYKSSENVLFAGFIKNKQTMLPDDNIFYTGRADTKVHRSEYVA